MIFKLRCTYVKGPNTVLLCRFLKHNLRHLSYINENLDHGNVCPACPQVVLQSHWLPDHICMDFLYIQNGGKIIYAMDALFGLPRKKSAGISHCDPLTGNLFFGEQSSVDEFASESKKFSVRDVS